MSDPPPLYKSLYIIIIIHILHNKYFICKTVSPPPPPHRKYCLQTNNHDGGQWVPCGSHFTLKMAVLQIYATVFLYDRKFNIFNRLT